MEKKINIPVWEKLHLTIEEAAVYSNIGENTIREFIDNNPNCKFIINIGRKKLIKRKEFELWNAATSIVK